MLLTQTQTCTGHALGGVVLFNFYHNVHSYLFSTKIPLAQINGNKKTGS